MRMKDRLDPVLLRELRTTVRPTGFGRVLTLGPAGVAAVVLLGALACSESGRSSAIVGRMLFHTYFVASYVLVALVSAVLGASGVARDAESGMLEAVGLTHLSPVRYLGGKLVAQWAVVLALLAATAPAAAVPLLWGGVAPVEIAAGSFVLAMVALLGLSTGIAVAARRTPVRWSIVTAVAVITPLSALALLFLQAPADAAREAWTIPVDGPFWFASIPLARADGDMLAFALVLPAFALAVVLSYLAQVALSGLAMPAAHERRPWGVERWLIASLILTAVGAAIARAHLPLEAGRMSAAAAILLAGALAILALLTRLGPDRDGPPRCTLRVVAPIVVLAGLGLAATVLLSQFAASWWGPPPRCSCAAPHVEPVLRVALHAFSFVTLAAGLAACARAFAGPRRSARVPTVAFVLLAGAAEFFAEVVHGSTASVSLIARISPLYALWSLDNDASGHLLAPSGVSFATALVAFGLAAVTERERSRRSV